MQGLNTTAVHAHGATFGVYGLLSLGLILVIIQSVFKDRPWDTKLMNVSFWGLNLGLALMILMSLLPIGLIQMFASINQGLWYARGSEVMQTEVIQFLRWIRFVGDAVFAVGALSFALAVLDRTGLLKFGGAAEAGTEKPELTAALK